MESRENSTSNYLMVNGIKAEVTEKVYKAHRSEIDKIRDRARSEHRCAQSNRLYCCGDCQSCRWHVNGCLESYEGSYLEQNMSLPANDNVENEAVSHMTMQAVYQKADELVLDGAAILQMHFEQQLTSREIAAVIGISHVAVNNRIRGVISYLREHRENFF